MNRKLILFICLLFNVGYIAKAQSYCDFLKKVREYQKSIKLNEHLEDENQIPEVDTTSFDINVYMSFFDRLKLRAGNRAFLISFYNRDTGSPALCLQDTAFDMEKFIDEIITKRNHYTDSIFDQKKSEYLSKNYQEDVIKRLDRIKENQKKSFTRNSALIQYAIDSTKRVCNNLIPEDTPIGYLQYLFFHQMGEQFSLFWHAYYREKTVICDKEDIDYFLSYYKERKGYFNYEENKIRDLLNIDLSPVVELDSTNCTIDWYEIYTHGGIYKYTYTIERTFPFRIKRVSGEKIAAISALFFY